VGGVPAGVVEQVRRELERLAELLPLTNRPGPDSASSIVRSFELLGFRAYYELDLHKAAITLVKLVRE